MSDPVQTDDPRVLLLTLRAVEATMLGDPDRLAQAVADAREQGLMFQWALSACALAGDLLRAREDGLQKLREWLIATEVEAAGIGVPIPEPGAGES